MTLPWLLLALLVAFCLIVGRNIVRSIPERKIEPILETPKGSGPDPAIPLERP
jgi:hypothetical protein